MGNGSMGMAVAASEALSRSKRVNVGEGLG
jgi:hypothetical protein